MLWNSSSLLLETVSAAKFVYYRIEIVDDEPLIDDSIDIKEQQSNAAKEVGDQYEKKEEKSKKPSFRPIASMITSSIPIIPSSSTSASTTASVSTSSSLNVSLKNETIPIIVDDPPTTTSSSQQKKKGRPRKHPI